MPPDSVEKSKVLVPGPLFVPRSFLSPRVKPAPLPAPFPVGELESANPVTTTTTFFLRAQTRVFLRSLFVCLFSINGSRASKFCRSLIPNRATRQSATLTAAVSPAAWGLGALWEECWRDRRAGRSPFSEPPALIRFLFPLSPHQQLPPKP